jgi:hypothetical protein
VTEREITPISSNYQTEPIETSFDWEEILSHFDGTEFYLFEFRSKLRPTANLALIKDLDNKAYEAAKKLNILYYFRGTTNQDGYNVSWCLWSELHLAKLASETDEHEGAEIIAFDSYDPFDVIGHKLRKTFEGIRFGKLEGRHSHP